MRAYLSLIFIFLFQILNSQGFRSRIKIPQASDNATKAFFEISPGNYIGAGFAVDTSSGNSYNHIIMVGLDALGNLQWTKKFKGYKLEYLNNGFIQRCFYKKGNYLYYAGCAVDTAGSQIGVFLKFDVYGDTVWQKSYRDSSSIDLIPQMVTAAVDGGFLITGFFQNWITHTQQGLIMKTDEYGNELWRKKINKTSPNVQDGKSIVQDSATKKIVIVGYQYPYGNSQHDNILILDSLGTKLSQGSVFPIGAWPTDLIQTKDKKFVMVGWQYYSQTVGGNNCQRSFAIKFDINNPSSPIWRFEDFDKLGLYNGFTCITELNNGDLLIGGLLDSLQGVYNGPNNQPSNQLTRLTIIDKDGVVKWNRYYNYKTNDSAEQNYQGIHSINLCQDGSWLAAIEGYNYPPPNPLFFVKYDGSGCDSTLEYCASLTQTVINTVGIKAYLLNGGISFYPNPASDYLMLEFETAMEVEAKIFDVSGREIKSIKLDQSKKVGVSDLVKGIYFMSLYKNSEKMYTYKFIKG